MLVTDFKQTNSVSKKTLSKVHLTFWSSIAPVSLAQLGRAPVSFAQLGRAWKRLLMYNIYTYRI
uniref:Uncharacterized protein n=1 Tax=Arion vulgaris TaxID=1028688 RepID=A0A0B7B073_9EUPU